MLITVKCNLFLCVYDTCLVFQSDVMYIEKQLNENFTNISDYFDENKHFRYDKTKSILLLQNVK